MTSGQSASLDGTAIMPSPTLKQRTQRRQCQSSIRWHDETAVAPTATSSQPKTATKKIPTAATSKDTKKNRVIPSPKSAPKKLTKNRVTPPPKPAPKKRKKAEVMSIPNAAPKKRKCVVSVTPTPKKPASKPTTSQSSKKAKTQPKEQQDQNTAVSNRNRQCYNPARPANPYEVREHQVRPPTLEELNQVWADKQKVKIALSDQEKMNMGRMWWENGLKSTRWIKFTGGVGTHDYGFIPPDYGIRTKKKMLQLGGIEGKHFGIGWVSLFHMVLANGEFEWENLHDKAPILTDYNAPPLPSGETTTAEAQTAAMTTVSNAPLEPDSDESDALSIATVTDSANAANESSSSHDNTAENQMSGQSRRRKSSRISTVTDSTNQPSSTSQQSNVVAKDSSVSVKKRRRSTRIIASAEETVASTSSAAQASSVTMTTTRNTNEGDSHTTRDTVVAATTVEPQSAGPTATTMQPAVGSSFSHQIELLLKQAMEPLQTETRTLQAKVQSLETENQSLRDQVQSLQESQQQSKQERMNLQQTIDRQTKTLQGKDAEMASLKVENQGIKDKLHKRATAPIVGDY